MGLIARHDPHLPMIISKVLMECGDRTRCVIVTRYGLLMKAMTWCIGLMAVATRSCGLITIMTID